MNKRQKKKKLYLYQIIFPYDYRSGKRVRRFMHSLTKRKNNRWRTRMKVHIQEEKAMNKKAIKDIFNFLKEIE